MITQKKNNLKDAFRAFTKVPLKRIEVSENLTIDDRFTFSLPQRDRTRTPRGAITDVPFGSLRSKGGGKLEVRARRENDANRCSKHPLADAVEFRYHISEINSSSGTSMPLPMQCINVLISKAALWRINLEAAAQGKRITGYLRWVNFTNPANNSGWSDVMTTIIA